MYTLENLKQTGFNPLTREQGNEINYERIERQTKYKVPENISEIYSNGNYSLLDVINDAAEYYGVDPKYIVAIHEHEGASSLEKIVNGQKVSGAGFGLRGGMAFENWGVMDKDDPAQNAWGVAAMLACYKDLYSEINNGEYDEDVVMGLAMASFADNPYPFNQNNNDKLKSEGNEDVKEGMTDYMIGCLFGTTSDDGTYHQGFFELTEDPEKMRKLYDKQDDILIYKDGKYQGYVHADEYDGKIDQANFEHKNSNENNTSRYEKIARLDLSTMIDNLVARTIPLTRTVRNNNTTRASMFLSSFGITGLEKNTLVKTNMANSHYNETTTTLPQTNYSKRETVTTSVPITSTATVPTSNNTTNMGRYGMSNYQKTNASTVVITTPSTTPISNSGRHGSSSTIYPSSYYQSTTVPGTSTPITPTINANSSKNIVPQTIEVLDIDTTRPISSSNPIIKTTSNASFRNNNSR